MSKFTGLEARKLASNKVEKKDPQIPRSLWWHTDANF